MTSWRREKSRLFTNVITCGIAKHDAYSVDVIVAEVMESWRDEVTTLHVTGDVTSPPWRRWWRCYRSIELARDVSQRDWRCVMKSWGGVMASLMKWAADRPKHLLACTLSLFSRQSNLPSNISREMHLQFPHSFSDFVELCSASIPWNSFAEIFDAVVFRQCLC